MGKNRDARANQTEFWVGNIKTLQEKIVEILKKAP
jgi:hypothetical protein